MHNYYETLNCTKLFCFTTIWIDLKIIDELMFRVSWIGSLTVNWAAQIYLFCYWCVCVCFSCLVLVMLIHLHVLWCPPPPITNIHVNLSHNWLSILKCLSSTIFPFVLCLWVTVPHIYYCVYLLAHNQNCLLVFLLCFFCWLLFILDLNILNIYVFFQCTTISSVSHCISHFHWNRTQIESAQFSNYMFLFSVSPTTKQSLVYFCFD